MDQVRCGCGMPRPRQRTVCSPLAGWLSLSSSTRTGTARRGHGAGGGEGQKKQSVGKALREDLAPSLPWGGGELRRQVDIK